MSDEVEEKLTPDGHAALLKIAEGWRRFDEAMRGQQLVNGWCDLPLEPLPSLDYYVNAVIEAVSREAARRKPIVVEEPQ